ncbi:hypothetical protein [Streptosporangium sp. NPDC006930]|uniref:hypothetical protein n=1 Tax=Streptosporangium sp. NPDC006930 TaxID=3154783 RepID=UPI003414B022
MCEHLDHIEQMRQLVEQLDAHRREVDEAYAEGFTIGFQEGEAVGYGRAHHEMSEEWSRIHRIIQEQARHPTWAEIRRNRGEVA